MEFTAPDLLTLSEIMEEQDEIEKDLRSSSSSNLFCKLHSHQLIIIIIIVCVLYISDFIPVI